MRFRETYATDRANSAVQVRDLIVYSNLRKTPNIDNMFVGISVQTNDFQLSVWLSDCLTICLVGCLRPR